MKKIVFFGVMASMLMASGAVLADSATLTTQDYVDDGLRILYKTIDELKADADSVYTKEEADAAFLTSASIADKANAADVYTKEEADAAFLTSASIAGKANVEDVYSKTDANTLFATKEDLAGIETETYSAALNGGISIDEDNQIALDITDPQEKAMYVYKDGAWVPLEVSGTFPNNYNFAAQ